MLILLVAFGAIVAAGVPVLLALSAVASAIGLSGLASHVFHDSGSTSSMLVTPSIFCALRARLTPRAKSGSPTTKGGMNTPRRSTVARRL